MLNPLYTAVSWVLLRWHQLFDIIGLNPDAGLTWALSIIMLTVTARLLLFRFFIKQVHYQRRMQEMQPKIKKLQDKHKGDKAALQREMMALQQSEGFNPISGCLPMLLQIPIFISLLHVLRRLKPGAHALYSWTPDQTESVIHARLFGAPLPAIFGFPLPPALHTATARIHELGGDPTVTRIVTLVLVIVSAVATLVTQLAVIRNAPTPAEGQAAMIQKLMLVGIPLSVLGSGFIFPLGVLLYWFTSNLWTMGQQFYIFKFHPHPSSVPAKAGVVAETNDLGRSLAPRPGARPANAKNARGSVAKSVSLDKSAALDDLATADGAGSSAPTGSTSPGASATTNRPASRSPRPGARPAAKRAPSKKRR
ncbi:membrane protein insertase YidC [Jatrophihabitans telluris]|uniref:Membrane protein insertase YidC n=1 Tax=Jatrophihabitans telluris TaxID=2038343 RepID=A0ABY4QZV4_9ACTN|nr:membrane protein insertase YidC [Jatrophihabitans telluris]UQX88551.1 membrane protein insertase YidC [Jatrophihabitans telluris]